MRTANQRDELRHHIRWRAPHHEVVIQITVINLHSTEQTVVVVVFATQVEGT